MAESAQGPVIRQGFLARRGRYLGGWTKNYYVLRPEGFQVYATPDISGRPSKIIPLNVSALICEDVWIIAAALPRCSYCAGRREEVREAIRFPCAN